MGLFSALFGGGKSKRRSRAGRAYIRNARSNQTRWIANARLRSITKRRKRPKHWF